jgi:hypothetical protein
MSQSRLPETKLLVPLITFIHRLPFGGACLLDDLCISLSVSQNRLHDSSNSAAMSNASSRDDFWVDLIGLYGNYTWKACKFTCNIIWLYSDFEGKILVITIFLFLCSLRENFFTLVLSELWGSPYSVLITWTLISSLVVGRICSDARMIDRTCDSLRFHPPVNCESTYVELTSETHY